jgi:hypothetical protein
MSSVPSPAPPRPMPKPAPKPVPAGHGPAHGQALAMDAPAGFSIPPRRRSYVDRIVPFASSVLLHAAVILVGMLTYQAIEIRLSPPLEQVRVADAAIIEHAAVGGIPHPGLGEDPLRRAAQADLPEAPPRPEAWNRQADLPGLEVAGGGERLQETLISVRGQHGAGRGTGIGGSAGVTGGGEVAMFGVPGGGGGLGPAAPFAGISGNARRVVYLCDGGSALAWGYRFDLLRGELQRAIDVLKPIQQFNVIFFTRDGGVESAHGQNLRVADGANKRQAAAFLRVTMPGPNADPVAGLRLAFQQNPQPELLYFLMNVAGTDIDLRTREKVRDEIRRLNAGTKVRINTIAFLSDLQQSPAEREKDEAWLREIAAENGGVFRSVSGEDLGR